MKFDLAQALYRLGVLTPDMLGDVGVALLEEGRNTPAVRQLAGLDKDATWRDVEDLFDRVLAELAQPQLTEVQAAYILAEAAASDIVAERVTPYEGAARIAYGAWHAAGMPDDLTGFYYWADEWEDHPEYREKCERDIMREAENFLANRRVASR